LNNLQPGQKIKVTIIEGKPMTPTSKPSPSPTKKSDIQIAPKTSGNTAKFGVTNLKPGQKIKITIKDGTKK
jgi:cold shock CspA family protein